MRTTESILVSLLPRHRVLHSSRRNLLLSLLTILAGLVLLGWCLYWLNNARTYPYRSPYSAQDESLYLIAAKLLLPAGLGLLGLGLSRVLRFRLLLRLTQLLFSLCLTCWVLVALFFLRLLSAPSTYTADAGIVILAGLALICAIYCAAISKLQHWLRQTRT